MAFSEVNYSRSCSLYLNYGTNANGTVKTVSVSIGPLNKSTWDKNKAGNIAVALADCMDYSLYAIRTTGIYELEEG